MHTTTPFHSPKANQSYMYPSIHRFTHVHSFLLLRLRRRRCDMWDVMRKYATKRRIMAGRSQKLPQSSLKAPSTPSSRACKLKRVSRGCEFFQACQPSCLGMQDASSSEPPPPPQSILPQFLRQCNASKGVPTRGLARRASTCEKDFKSSFKSSLLNGNYYIRNGLEVGTRC